MSQHNTIQSRCEDILGQFCFALGQGAGTMRIQRDAICALRARYRDPVTDSLDRWSTLAPNVLSFVTQVGRVAALQATQDGRTAISAADFTYARQLVESQVHRSGERTHGIFAGPICPAVPGEQVPQPATNSEESTPENIVSKLFPIVATPTRTVN